MLCEIIRHNRGGIDPYTWVSPANYIIRYLSTQEITKSFEAEMQGREGGFAVRNLHMCEHIHI